MIGLTRGTVKLASNHEFWNQAFLEEKHKVLNVLPNVSIEHVGSTAVKNLLAKPIIDILLGYSNKNELNQIKSALTELGYQFKGEEGVEGRSFFVKGSEDKREFYLHAFPKDHEEYKNHLKFRNWLRKHPEDAEKYSKLKKQLADKYPKDRKSYTSGKNQFISSSLKKAS